MYTELLIVDMLNNLWINTPSLLHVQKEYMSAFKCVFGGFILCEGITFCVLAAKECTNQNKAKGKYYNAMMARYIMTSLENTKHLIAINK